MSKLIKPFLQVVNDLWVAKSLEPYNPAEISGVLKDSLGVGGHQTLESMKNGQISSLLLQYFVSQLFIPRPTYQI
jgi:hypothetical protein